MADDFTNVWAAVVEHEAYGRPAPVLEEGTFEPWCVIELAEDDPPICTCDMKEQAVKVAEALNLAEFHYWLFQESTEEDEDKEE
jgi:hypothetical protein